MSTIKVTAPKPAVKQTSLGKLADSQEKLKLALADMGCVVTECCEEEGDEVSQDDLNNLAQNLYMSIDRIYSMVSDMYSRIYDSEDKMYEMFWQHQKGHIPAINSVEQMARAIEALGLSSEIEVQKRVIYASDGKASKIQWETSIK